MYTVGTRFYWYRNIKYPHRLVTDLRCHGGGVCRRECLLRLQ